MVELAGVTAIEAKAGRVTVTTVEPLTEPDVALIVAVPVATAVVTPEELIVATDGVEVVQRAEFVMLPVVPLL